MPRGFAASVHVAPFPFRQHGQTFRTLTTAVAAAHRGGVIRDLERKHVHHDSRPVDGSENYGGDLRSTRRAFLSKVAAFAGVTAGVLPAAVAGAGEVRSVREVKKGIEEDFLSRYVNRQSVPYSAGNRPCRLYYAQHVRPLCARRRHLVNTKIPSFLWTLRSRKAIEEQKQSRESRRVWGIDDAAPTLTAGCGCWRKQR